MTIDPNKIVEDYCRNWDGVTPYAKATIVHTEGATAAKAGAKAVVTSSGELIGWIGGGCLRGAVLRAARQVMDATTPKFIRIRPKEDIAGPRDADGVELYPSGCPSKGRADVFIEPVLPKPPLIIIGASQIAHAVADLGSCLNVRIVPVSGDLAALEPPLERQAGIERGFIIIATQGVGDLAALKAALATNVSYISFVGSTSKVKALRERLMADGVPESSLARLRAPAGLDIGAKTPAEIAISILAELIKVHRTAESQI
jgi:xanthine dehydrogenase accessory factor